MTDEQIQVSWNNFIKMKQSTSQEEFQISQFIKEPANLKLLILAGTNIRSSQLITISRCTSLVKLDLSSNQLSDIPLKFSIFTSLRILYLHENCLSSITVSQTNLEYISLFDNPIKGYRSQIVRQNARLLAIDYNVITKNQRTLNNSPKHNTLLKWPIVEISQNLQKEEDYLNLLKAQIFVITQVQKRANFIETVNNYLSSFANHISFIHKRHTVTNQNFFKVEFMKKQGLHWMNYTEKKKKLKRILQGTKVQTFLLNKIQRAKLTRSPQVAKVLDRFIQSIRARMIARKVLEKNIRQYRQHIQSYRVLEQNIISQPLKLYFLSSQLHYINKLFLFIKKLYFNMKEYDICDKFDQIVRLNKKQYYIYRKSNKKNTFIMEMISNTMRLILAEKDLDRRHLLYNRQGHKRNQIKNVNLPRKPFDRQKYTTVSERIQRKYKLYDTLIEYDFKNEKIFLQVIKLIKYFNSGNHKEIMQNQAAYFQTEVIFKDQQQKLTQKIYFGCYSAVQRVIAANIIQRSWRKYHSNKKLKRNIISQIKTTRAHNLIGKWLRNLPYRHKINLNKIHSFYQTNKKQVEYYLQMDIYLNLPFPKNILKHKLIKNQLHSKYLYDILHKQTQYEIAEMNSRKWVKIRFMDSNHAFEVKRQLSVLTYRYYYNGTFIKLFTLNELQSCKDLGNYEQKINKMFKIKVNVQQISNKTCKKIQIDNSHPFFIWPLVQQGFGSMFKPQETQSLPISVFIYNKTKRPLKVNCELMWTTPSSLYFYRKRQKIIMRVRTPKRQYQPQVDLSQYLPHLRLKKKRDRQLSMHQHRSLLHGRSRGLSEINQLNLLSETLNIRRS